MSNLPVEQRTFDRLVEFDEKSRQYPIRAIVPQEPVSKLWGWGPVLDQGTEGSCVGHGWAAELGAEPVPLPTSHELAVEIYYRARQLDEWEGENYSGSSVIAGAKAVQERNWMTEYRWAFGIDDLRLALGHQGPAVMGTAWLSGMDAKPNGVINVHGEALGGHCWLMLGVLLEYPFAGEGTDEWYIGQNSWGEDWGDHGLFYLRRRDVEKLLGMQGEACIPIARQH